MGRSIERETALFEKCPGTTQVFVVPWIDQGTDQVIGARLRPEFHAGAFAVLEKAWPINTRLLRKRDTEAKKIRNRIFFSLFKTRTYSFVAIRDPGWPCG